MNTVTPNHRFSNEVTMILKTDRNGCLITTFFEAHGSFVESLPAAGFPIKAGGKDAIKQTSKLFAHFKEQGLVRHRFTGNGNTYWSAHAPSILA